MKKLTVKRAALWVCALLLLTSLFGCQSSAPLFADLDFTAVDPASVSETTDVTDYVKITVADYGDIIIRLYPEVAPKTVANFQSLVAQSYYDGIIFHRVIETFVIQAGDPDGDGYGNGDVAEIKGEFSANGFENNLKHIRGVVSMARSGNDYNSASSQFFICHESSVSVKNLDRKYASFGYVVSGMDVVDAIARVATNSSDKPLVDVVIEKACFVTVNP